MVVFRAIGAFFARIWRWIKETAWVQPLLIVGIIFGVIFSIPSIVNGITSLVEKINSSDSYYHKFQQSLVGGETSAADELTEAVNRVMEDSSTRKATADKYGEKFFLMYVSTTCPSCKEAREGFETLETRFTDYVRNGKDSFKMYTVFTDEKTNDTTTDQSAFVKYMNRNLKFMENAATVGYASEYYLNGKISETDLINVESCDENDFLTPTIFFVDLSEQRIDPGVSEIMFGVTGDTNVAKAQHLADCWQHTGDFAVKGA